MFDECSFRRNNPEQKFVFKCRFTLTYQRLLLFNILILSIVFVCLNFTSTSIIPTPKNSKSSSFRSSRKSFVPIIARTLYLFLCENQAEIDTYSRIFPSISSDVAFYCWHENCNASRFRSSLHLHTNTWSNETKRNERLVSLHPIPSFHSIKSRIFIINEKELNVTKKLTWTTARNKLYELALNEERRQGWAWAYYIFADGDVHTACPLAEQLLSNKTVVDYGRNEEYLFASHFRSFVNLTKVPVEEEKCFLLFDAFLLSIRPALATIAGGSGPMAYPGLLTQIAYHIDAMFNAIQHDALPFLLPYCPRYDERNWWTSQAIFVYRSLCLYGHTLSFNGIHVIRQNHRAYPRAGSAWSIDDDMNLVPNYLLPLRNYMKQSRFVSALVLHHYSGWNLELTSETCRQNHTSMKLDTCLVHGNNRAV